MRRTNMSDLLGVVLCGGKSTRMGEDKGLIAQNHHVWAEAAAEKLKAHCKKVVCSINKSQLQIYESRLRDSELHVDSSQYENIGPLGGLLSVHKKFPSYDILLLACDMIFIEDADLKQLIDSAGDMRAYRTADVFEPLCAYYSAVALRSISTLYEAQEIPRSLQRILQTAAQIFPELRVTALLHTSIDRLKSQNTALS